MSRIGKSPITVPEKTEISVADGRILVKGPRGQLSRELHPLILIEIKDGVVQVSPKEDTYLASMLWGTYASHIRNMISGVNEAFEKKLVVEGIGYRVEQSGNDITLSVGFSHTVKLPIPEGISVVVKKNEITISGSDKEKVGQFAADIRAVKKPEPYKGKGIRYSDEVVRRKQGKKAIA